MAKAPQTQNPQAAQAAVARLMTTGRAGEQLQRQVEALGTEAAALAAQIAEKLKPELGAEAKAAADKLVLGAIKMAMDGPVTKGFGRA